GLTDGWPCPDDVQPAAAPSAHEAVEVFPWGGGDRLRVLDLIQGLVQAVADILHLDRAGRHDLLQLGTYQLLPFDSLSTTAGELHRAVTEGFQSAHGRFVGEVTGCDLTLRGGERCGLYEVEQERAINAGAVILGDLPERPEHRG